MVSFTSVLAASALLVSSISAQDLDLSKVSLTSVTFGGTGCTQGTQASFKQTGDSSFIATFPSITAAIGPTVNIDDNRKNCQINFKINYPAGVQYAAVSTRYSGNTVLDKGVKGTLATTFYFSGQTAQAATQQTLTGPIAQGYDVTQSIADSAVVWSACGDSAAQNLNVNSAVSLTAASDSACGSWTDSGDFQVAVKWRKC